MCINYVDRVDKKYLNHMQLSTLFVKELKHLCHSVVSYFDKGGLNLIFNAHAFVLKKGSVYNCVLRGIHTLHKLYFETKSTKLYSKMLLVKSSENNFVFLPVFYLIMWLMKALKNFGKIAILKM